MKHKYLNESYVHKHISINANNTSKCMNEIKTCINSYKMNLYLYAMPHEKSLKTS
jgi:hypothetical protein